jgi:hypothetical protein
MYKKINGREIFAIPLFMPKDDWKLNMPDSTGKRETNVTAQNLVWCTKAQTLHGHCVNLT